MKFLCVRCDEPMRLAETLPPDRGSLTVVFARPRCASRVAMLTNPHETQLVQSLGVRIGPAGEGPAAPAEAPGCPFAQVAREAASTEPGGIPWTPGAESRLDRIPEFVRPMARAGIERFARERGALEVDEHVLDAAREFFGM